MSDAMPPFSPCCCPALRFTPDAALRHLCAMLPFIFRRRFPDATSDCAHYAPLTPMLRRRDISPCLSSPLAAIFAFRFFDTPLSPFQMPRLFRFRRDMILFCHFRFFRFRHGQIAAFIRFSRHFRLRFHAMMAFSFLCLPIRFALSLSAIFTLSFR
jgi:hypothetical protein